MSTFATFETPALKNQELLLDALRKLGFRAEEGEIAILAHTSTAIGTPPDVLCAALRTKYGASGLGTIGRDEVNRHRDEASDKLIRLGAVPVVQSD